MFGRKMYKVVVGVCVHTLGCREERNGHCQAMDGSGQSLCGPGLHGRGALSSSGDPGRCPRLPLPLVCSPAEHLYSTFQRKNGLPLCICCGSNKLPLFLPTLKHYKKQPRVGRCLLGREPHFLSTVVGRSNVICAPGPTPACASFEMHTHAPYYRLYTHKHISKSNRVQSLLSGLSSTQAYSSLS